MLPRSESIPPMVRASACSCKADALEYTMQKLSLPYLKRKIMQPDEMTLAVCLAPQTTMKASHKVNEWTINNMTHMSDNRVVNKW